MARATRLHRSYWIATKLLPADGRVEVIAESEKWAAVAFSGDLAEQDLLTGCGCLVEGKIDEKGYLRRGEDLAGDGVGAYVLAEDDKRLSRVVYLEIEA